MAAYFTYYTLFVLLLNNAVKLATDNSFDNLFFLFYDNNETEFYFILFFLIFQYNFLASFLGLMVTMFQYYL